MREPIPVDAARLFEFIGGSGLSVILISIHPLHTFNPALGQQLGGEHQDMALGTLDLADLLLVGGPGLRFLHQGLRRIGAPTAFGVMPGYCLFRRGEMLAWDVGLPAFEDVVAIAHSAVLGAVWSSVTRDLAFVGRALRLATEQVAAERVAARFRYAVANGGASDRGSDWSGPGPADDLYWAYQTLGVVPTATDREIHEAWRRARAAAHPDHAAQDPAEFARRGRISVEINRARDVIVHRRSGSASRATA